MLTATPLTNTTNMNHQSSSPCKLTTTCNTFRTNRQFKHVTFSTTTTNFCIFIIAMLLIVCSISSTAQAETQQDPHIHTHHTQQEQQQQVHQQMNDLVDSVKQAVHDADASSQDKNQVIDIGQSLTLLETKFTNLRSALVSELGVSKDKINQHSSMSKELMEKSTDLVKSVVSQRDELSKLSMDIDDLDTSIRHLRDGLYTFENDMKELNGIVQELYHTNRQMSYDNDHISHKVNKLLNDKRSVTSVNHKKFKIIVFFIIVEICLFAAFVYVKIIANNPAFSFSSKSSSRSNSAFMNNNKAFGKFG